MTNFLGFNDDYDVNLSTELFPLPVLELIYSDLWHTIQAEIDVGEGGISPDQLILGEPNFTVWELRGSDDKVNCFWTTWPSERPTRALCRPTPCERMPRGKPPGQSWPPRRPIQTTACSDCSKQCSKVMSRCTEKVVASASLAAMFAQEQSFSFITHTQLSRRDEK